MIDQYIEKRYTTGEIRKHINLPFIDDHEFICTIKEIIKPGINYNIYLTRDNNENYWWTFYVDRDKWHGRRAGADMSPEAVINGMKKVNSFTFLCTFIKDEYRC